MTHTKRPRGFEIKVHAPERAFPWEKDLVPRHRTVVFENFLDAYTLYRTTTATLSECAGIARLSEPAFKRWVNRYEYWIATGKVPRFSGHAMHPLLVKLLEE